MSRIPYYLCVCFIFCNIIFFSGCTSKSDDGYLVESTNNRSAIGIADIDGFSIVKISVMNGMNGESGTIDDRETIEKLIVQLNQYSLEKMEEQEPLNGYRYYMDFYSDSGKVSRITIVGEDIVNVDGVYYEVYGTPISITAVQELIEPGIMPDENTIKKTDLRISSLINNSSEINKISIRNGLSQESGVVENTTKIEELISCLDGYPLEEFSGDFLFNGYQYIMYFHTDSGYVSRVCTVNNNMVQVNGVLYEVVGPSIDLTEFEEFISSFSGSASTSGDEGLSVDISGEMQYLSVEDLVSHSDILIIGTVTGAYPSRWNTRNGQRPEKSNDELDIGTEDMIYTDIGVHVNKYLKNALDTGDLQITIDGGSVGNDYIWVEDNPSFEYGENILLFLNWNIGEEPEFTVTGGYQGKFTMVDNETAVRADGVSVIITELYDHWVITERTHVKIINTIFHNGIVGM